MDTEQEAVRLLYGEDDTQNIVSVEPGDNGLCRVYRRDHTGVAVEEYPFKPWMFLRERPEGELKDCEISELEGEGFSILASFHTVDAFFHAQRQLRKQHIKTLSYSNFSRQALIQSGKTLFKGMHLDDSVRLQFDLETTGLNPNAYDAKILLIAVSDNRGLLDVIEGDETEIIRKFISLVQSRDPDIIEGHNILGFDMPYLQERAKQLSIPLKLGRDNREPTLDRRREYAIGGNSRPFIPIFLYGRHLVDTYLVVQRFDWTKGALSSYGLKECARHFGIAAENRIELPREDMNSLYRNDRDRVVLYAKQDVIETKRLAEIITPVEFYQTQMTPDNYGNVVIMGAGEKINSIMIRAYFAKRHAVPVTQVSQEYLGGYTEVCLQGLQKRVVKADVESLYPSLMLTHNIAPKSDALGVFLPCLRWLTRMRLAAKQQAADAEASGSSQYAYYDGVQSSYKVLINSFYGYLGGPFPFNDPEAAGKVTALGRTLVQKVSARLKEIGCSVIEIDTDGVFFVPPASVQTEKEERECIEQVGNTLPSGIRLAFDGRYRKMLSIKAKNYVLETYGGKKIFRGSSLRSRADEQFGRRFLERAIDLLMVEDLDGVHTLYLKTAESIRDGILDISELLRRERVSEKTFVSQQKRRMANAAKGLAIGDFVYLYEKNDGSLGLIEEYDNDENRKHYLEKLYKFARRLYPAFENMNQFDQVFPKPAMLDVSNNSQQSLDLP